MTISFPAFEVIEKKVKLAACYNNDGTILIYKSSSKKKFLSRVHLKPTELKELIEKGSFYSNGIRPGMFPYKAIVRGKVVEDRVVLKERMYKRCRQISFNKKHLIPMYEGCEDVWGEFKNICRPLIGLNCVAGSFDAMKGDLSPIKNNEEIRLIAKELFADLKNNPDYT